MKTLSALNPEDRKLRLQSFFDTEEDLGYFTTFLSTVVVEKKNEPKKKRGKNSKTSTGKRKWKDVLNGTLTADYNFFEDRQSSSNDDADDEKEEMTGTPLSSRRKVASKKRDLPFNSIEFGFLRDSVASAPNQQLQEDTSERPLKAHQFDCSRESPTDAQFPSLSTSRSSSDEIAHMNQPRSSIIDLVPTPIPIIQQNEHAYFRMMLIDDDFKNLFHNLLKS